MGMTINYAAPGVMTRLQSVPEVLGGYPTGATDRDALDVVWPVHDLVLQPRLATELGLPAERMAEKDLRRASDLEAVLLARDPRPLTEARPPAARVVGTCRHFAVLACALLRAQGVPARVRCGFATYFVQGLALDHWVIEVQDPREARGVDRTGDDATRDDSVGGDTKTSGTPGCVAPAWTRLDPEILGGDVIDHPERLRPGQFLTGGEAWTLYRAGHLDPATCGVWGTANFGPAEISGNAVRDLAALNGIEMLPWDEWGRMTEAYAGRTGPDYDALIDRVAAACCDDAEDGLAALFQHPDLRVPPHMLG